MIPTKLKDLECDIPPERRIVYPLPGYAWNPARDFPRNHECFCGSKKKFKKCCDGTLDDVIPKDKVEKIKQFLKEFIAGKREAAS